MTKKHRKFKRMLALLGVVVVLASLFVIPSSAWELTDIPFYNFFDVSVIPNVSIGEGKIVGNDPDKGIITMQARFSNSGQLIMVYPLNIGRTLRECCPDMVAGEKYTLSTKSILTDLGGGGTYVDAIEGLGLADLNNKGDVWYSGETRVITEDMLAKRVYFYVGKSGDSPRFQPSLWQNDLQIWINKGETAQEFCSYDIGKELKKNVYNKGYNDAYREFAAKNYVFTSSTMSQVNFGFMEGTDTGKINKYTYANKEDGILYSFAGNTYNTNSFNSSYYVPPSGYNLAKIGATFDLEAAEVDVWFGKTPLILTAKGCEVQIAVFTSKSGEYSVSVDATAQPKTVDVASLFDSRMYGKKVLCVKVNVYCANKHTESSVYDSAFYATLSTGDASGYEYNLGYDAGYAKGEVIGFENGEEKGYKDGLEKGEDIGYENGKQDGYYKGRADEASESTFFTLIFDVIDAPVKVLSQVLNFEILGVDMLGLASSLLTFAILVTVVKYFV